MIACNSTHFNMFRKNKNKCSDRVPVIINQSRTKLTVKVIWVEFHNIQ
jgi:hypothetical protein